MSRAEMLDQDIDRRRADVSPEAWVHPKDHPGGPGRSPGRPTPALPPAPGTPKAPSRRRRGLRCRSGASRP